MLTHWFTEYARWILRHRKTVAVLVLAATALLTFEARQLRIEVDPDKQVPEGHPYIATLRDLHTTFGDKNLVVVGLVPRDGRVFSPTFLAKLAEVTRRLSAIPGANPTLVQSIAAGHMKDVQGTSESIEVLPLMEEVPQTQAEADEVRRRVFANDAFVGTLVSADGRAAAIQASFELTPVTPEYRSLHRAIVRELEAADDGTFDYELTGLVILLSELSRYSAKIALVFPVALLVIALVHFDAFRTFQGLALPMVTALLAVLWAVGLMGMFGIPLDPLNTTTPILILAVAAGHAVQVLKRFYEEYEKLGDVEAAIVSCIGHIGPVMVGAGIVATLSFWSLMAFETPSIRTFGAFAGLGILSAMIVEMTIIPVVRAWLPAPQAAERSRQARPHPVFDPLLRWASDASIVGRRATVAAVILGVVLAAICARRVEVKTSLLGKFRPTDRIRIDDQAINSRFSGTNTLIALVEGREDGALEDPRIVTAIDGLERMLEGEPSVGKAHSYVDVLKRLHRAATADDPASPTLPESTDLVAQYLLLHSMSGGGDSLDAILDRAHRVAKIRVLVREGDTGFGDSLIAKATQFVHERFPSDYRVRFTGTLASTSAATEAMVQDKLANIVQMGAMTVLISSILLNSVIGGILVVLPLVMTVLFTFGVMGAVGVPLDTMTAAIAAMAVGIGADYAMYFLFRVREEARAGRSLEVAVSEAIRTSGKAILFVSSAVAAGYATLAMTGFSMHQNLGLLVALAMVVSAASTILVVPMLVRWWQPAFLGAADAARTAARPEPEFEPLPGEFVTKPRLPRDFYEIDIFASLAFVTVAAGLFIGGGWAAATVATSTMSLLVRVPLTMVLVLVAAHGGHLLGFVGHEGIHLNLVRNKYGSVLLGSLLSSMVSFMAIGYGVSHWSHHRFTNREQDPDARLYSAFPTFWRRFFFARPAGSRSHTRNTIAAALGRSLGPGHRLPFSPRTQRALAVANLGFLASWIVVYVMIAMRNPLAAFVGIALPILVLIPMSGLRGYLEHGGTDRGAVRDSRSYASPLYTLLFFGNNLHLEHHMYPGVPCYRLPRLHRWLRAEGIFARHAAHVDYTVTGPWQHTTGRSQYPFFTEEGRTHIVFGSGPMSATPLPAAEHPETAHARRPVA